ncbi:Alpha/Beta hydrolase protein [Mycena leptocephala]|nr:Alpha/Beta hydrolase protein [Mycena leptocephala]
MSKLTHSIENSQLPIQRRSPLAQVALLSSPSSTQVPEVAPFYHKISEVKGLCSGVTNRTTSHAGYIGLQGNTDETPKRSFFWYFEAENDARNAPIIDSSILLQFDCGRWPRNEWDDESALRPIGVGFSYGSRVNSSRVAAYDVYDFLQKFFVLFPHLASGSYGGVFVQNMATVIHEQNVLRQSGWPGGIHINLEALILSDPVTDPMSHFRWLLQYRCMDHEVFNSASCKTLYSELPFCLESIDMAFEIPTVENRVKAWGLCHHLDFADTNGTVLEDVRRTCHPDSDAPDACHPQFDWVAKFFGDPAIKAALGIPHELNFSAINMEVNAEFHAAGDIILNRMQKHHLLYAPLLAAGIRLLYYVGAQDANCAWPGIFSFVHFISAPDVPWPASEVATVHNVGRGAGNMTYILLREAGHFTVNDQPRLPRSSWRNGWQMSHLWKVSEDICARVNKTKGDEYPKICNSVDKTALTKVTTPQVHLMPLTRIRVFKLPSSLSRCDWLDASVETLKLLQDGSGLLPVPYVQEALAIVIRILEGIQRIKRNREEFEELAQDMVDSVVTIRDTILEHPNVPASYFTRRCHDLVRIRQEINRKRNLVKRRMTNFQLMLSLDIRLFIEEHIPRSLVSHSTIGSSQFRLVDAMNIEFTFPLNVYPTYQDFIQLLPSLFLNRVGKKLVDSGDYELMAGENDSSALMPSTWRNKVIGGSTVWMNVVLKNQARDSRQCPRCNYLCLYATLGDNVTCCKWIVNALICDSSSCQTVFRVSEAFIQEDNVSGTLWEGTAYKDVVSKLRGADDVYRPRRRHSAGSLPADSNWSQPWNPPPLGISRPRRHSAGSLPNVSIWRPPPPRENQLDIRSFSRFRIFLLPPTNVPYVTFSAPWFFPSTNASLRLQIHPWLHGDVPSQEFIFDLSMSGFGPHRIVAPDQAMPLSAKDYQARAFNPPVTKLRITCDMIPHWPIDISFANERSWMQTPPITLGDILVAIHQKMHQSITHADWERLSMSEEVLVSRAFTRRCRMESMRRGRTYHSDDELPERQLGVKVVDFLLGRNMFRGLVRSEDGHVKMVVS